MKNKISKFAGLIPSIGGTAAFIVPLMSLAQTKMQGPDAQLPPVNIVKFTDISGIFCTIMGWVFTILILLSVLFILWAAYTYMRSAGDEEKVKDANHQLFYAAIAIIVAIISRGIPFIIATMFNADLGEGCK